MSPDVRYRGGSTVKMMISSAALQLVEEAKLGLDNYLPELLPQSVVAMIANSGAISLRMLLNHTSGIADRVDPEWPASIGWSGFNLGA